MASRIFAITFFAIVVLLLYQIGIILAPFLVPVLWATLLGRFAFPRAIDSHQDCHCQDTAGQATCSPSISGMRIGARWVSGSMTST